MKIALQSGWWVTLATKLGKVSTNKKLVKGAGVSKLRHHGVAVATKRNLWKWFGKCIRNVEAGRNV